MVFVKVVGSCPGILARIDHYINTTFARKQNVTFLDIEKAYDTTWKHHILCCLYTAGFCGPLPNLVQNFMSGRTFQVKFVTTLSDRIT